MEPADFRSAWPMFLLSSRLGWLLWDAALILLSVPLQQDPPCAWCPFYFSCPPNQLSVTLSTAAGSGRICFIPLGFPPNIINPQAIRAPSEMPRLHQSSTSSALKRNQVCVCVCVCVWMCVYERETQTVFLPHSCNLSHDKCVKHKLWAN